ncbi:pyrroline-5-carboxylate reductase [Vitreoscilla stercoraria]|uniref:Pyrroline-5-carboxylate reductase n=1 Tax=Vitreoscilla stercoraria TaxID=61 RepID=A0ABY4E9I7_VITST|nr:pyrroline-5-carboxylate reductase [Vitreoscilla stercoraria]UOO92424.1 pyrroline-5-carboxylate reductase [Vitreoscilla stercoraria]
MQKLYFLGGGNMCQAIVSGLIKTPRFDITVIESHADKRQYLQDAYGVAVAESLPSLHAEDVLLLAVKPQDMAQALSDARSNGALILSIAAGLDTQTLAAMAGNERVIRIMPNTPAQVGLGVAGLYAPAHIAQSDKDIATQIMQSVGAVHWLDVETQMHAITGVSGSGPAYVFYLLEALAQAAQQQGFDVETARELSLATFKGAVTLAEQSGLPFAQLQQNVTSKGGTTFAAISALEAAQVAQGIEQGVAACVARSEEMQQQLSQA